MLCDNDKKAFEAAQQLEHWLRESGQECYVSVSWTSETLAVTAHLSAFDVLLWDDELDDPVNLTFYKLRERLHETVKEVYDKIKP